MIYLSIKKKNLIKLLLSETIMNGEHLYELCITKFGNSLGRF